MTEYRKIVLILGNGFDLGLGLKTSYKDFWESEYCPKDYPAPLIRYLNETLGKGIENVRWYDLENELYNYYRQIAEGSRDRDIITSTEQQFLIHFDPHIVSRLHYSRYEKEINSLIEKGIVFVDSGFRVYMDVPYLEDLRKDPVSRDKEALLRIKKGLSDYLKGLDYLQTIQTAVSDESHPSMPLAVLEMAIVAGKCGCCLDIFSFNYTNLLPYISDHQIMGAWMHYIHGRCETGDVIIGTRDDVDISEEYDFLYKSFAPGFNPQSIVPALRDARDVIIFGHSLGENDQQYFKDFFARQTVYGDTAPKNITIFTKDDDSVVETKRALRKMTNNRLSNLSALNNLKIIKTTGTPTEEEAAELGLFFDEFESNNLKGHGEVNGVNNSFGWFKR